MARQQITQQQLADALKREQTWVSRRVSGRVGFTINELFAVATALGIPPRQLFAGVLNDEPVAS